MSQPLRPATYFLTIFDTPIRRKFRVLLGTYAVEESGTVLTNVT
jgi:hypothetical protein